MLQRLRGRDLCVSSAAGGFAERASGSGEESVGEYVSSVRRPGTEKSRCVRYRPEESATLVLRGFASDFLTRHDEDLLARDGDVPCPRESRRGQGRDRAVPTIEISTMIRLWHRRQLDQAFRAAMAGSTLRASFPRIESSSSDRVVKSATARGRSKFGRLRQHSDCAERPAARTDHLHPLWEYHAQLSGRFRQWSRSNQG